MVFESIRGLAVLWVLFGLVAVLFGRRSPFIWGTVFYLFCIRSFFDLGHLAMSEPSWTLLQPLVWFHILLFGFFLLQKIKAPHPLLFAFPVVLMFYVKADSFLLFVGVSYLSFRLIYLQFEILEKRVVSPTFSQYLMFCCFPFSFQMGPITSYEEFHNSLQKLPNRFQFSEDNLILFFKGAIKFFFLSHVFRTVLSTSFSDNLENVDSFFDFIIYVNILYLWIYCNFSGFTNMMVAASAIVGIEMKLNFDNPLYALNIRQFWEKWHMSLTDLLRELVFMPMLLKFRRIKWIPANLVMPFLFLVFFMAVGVWHGLSISFLLLGIYHAIGVSLHFFYEKYLASNLGGIRQSLGYRFLSWVLTFQFICFSFVFFANSYSEILNWLQM